MDERIEPGDPRYDGFRITDIWAALAIDPKDNQEGIPALPGTLIPLIAADERRLEDVRVAAKIIAAKLEHPVRIVRFVQAEDVEVIDP